jgi:hypothetical protein
MFIALARIILEFSRLDLSRLPIAMKLDQYTQKPLSRQLHKFGFYVSLGFFILHTPKFLGML